jgi:hypothetical protein
MNGGEYTLTEKTLDADAPSFASTTITVKAGKEPAAAMVRGVELLTTPRGDMVTPGGAPLMNQL